MKNQHIMKQLLTLKPSECIHEKFSFDTFNNAACLEDFTTRKGVPNCGTSGCLAGELPGITSKWFFRGFGELLYVDSEKLRGSTLSWLCYYFDLSDDVINQIFYPGYDIDDDGTITEIEHDGVKYNRLHQEATLEEVQSNAIEVLKTMGIDILS